MDRGDYRTVANVYEDAAGLAKELRRFVQRREAGFGALAPARPLTEVEKVECMTAAIQLDLVRDRLCATFGAYPTPIIPKDERA